LNDEFFLSICLTLAKSTIIRRRSGLSIGLSDYSIAASSSELNKSAASSSARKLLTRPATPISQRNLFYNTHGNSNRTFHEIVR
jgi:hypothetical protein